MSLSIPRKMNILRRAPRVVLQLGLNLQHAGVREICSLSSRTIAYKGQQNLIQLRDYYSADLGKEGFTCYMALVHSRFSTNTSPSLDQAQPIHLSYSGEVNALKGNANWIKPRDGLLKFKERGISKKALKKHQPSVVASSSGSGAFDGAKAVESKGTTKICIALRSFGNPLKENPFWELPPSTRKIGLPGSRVLYTVLRSPHIDKKSREQFKMEIKKQFLVMKTESHELGKKLFWLKRHRIFGAQYEIQLSCKTRLDKEKLRQLL